MKIKNLKAKKIFRLLGSVFKWSLLGVVLLFTLLLLLYRTSVKSQGMKQLMAGGGVALIGTTLVPLLKGLFG